MTRWGGPVIDRLQLRGDERVLDAGCGSGRVTQQLLEKLPEGHVVALDASAEMIEEARKRIGDDARVELVCADLMDPLPVDEVDAILSTATFHWVPDHDRLFANLAAKLRPGGLLSAQCGGVGNLQSVHDAAHEVRGDDPNPKNYTDPQETTLRLQRAGFVDVDCWLQPEPTMVEPRSELETYLATIVLRAELQEMPEGKRAEFVSAVVDQLAEPVLDYVRLNIVARRGG